MSDASVAPLRYEKVAQLIRSQIASGALRSSDRVPSVRAMSRAARVSVATVVQAYLRLEAAGVIESRPQSGFYVSSARTPVLPQPKPQLSRSARPRSVATEVLDACREAMQRSDIVPLNAAMTTPAMYPNRRLNALIREVLREHPLHAGELVTSPGDLALRREIAKRLSLTGAATDPDDIVITAGAMDAMTLSLRVLCRPGDTVLVESPTYFGILQTIESLRLKVIEVPNHPGRGIDVDAVRAAVRGNPLAAAVLMPNFNNPVGSLTPDEAKRELVQVLCGAGVPIVEDDIYGDLHHGSERPRTLRSFDGSGLVITCGSISKTIAIGFRLGWAASTAFRDELARQKFYASVACPTLQQHVLARYYASGGYERFLRRLRADLVTNTRTMMDAVARHFPPGTKLAQPDGGVVLWLELPPAVDAIELFRTALAQRIGITPGIVFSATARYRNFIRLNCSLPWSVSLEQAVAQLGAMVGSMA